MKLITETLSFLQRFSVRKTTTQLFQYFRNSIKKNINFRISIKSQNINKKNYISSIFWAFKSKLQIIHGAAYIALFLPDSNNRFFICLFPYIHICLYYFLILCFYFHLLFHTLLATRHILKFAMFDLISLQPV